MGRLCPYIIVQTIYELEAYSSMHYYYYYHHYHHYYYHHYYNYL